MGLAQAKVILDLRQAVEGTNNRLGIYYTVPERRLASSPSAPRTFIPSY